MTKTEARRIHAHFSGAARLASLFPVAVLLQAILMGLSPAESLAWAAWAMAFAGLVAAVSTDMLARRIPNEISLLVFVSGIVWWASWAAGATLPAAAGTGVIWDVIAPLYGVDAGGSVLPAFDGITYPGRAALDVAALLVTFVPLYLSFALGLGFGGGDVKLMAGLILFLGWPLGFDFFLLTFIVGGFFSVGAILGRMCGSVAVRAGAQHPRWEWMRDNLREFPFAPPIAIAAMICFAIKLQGLN